MRLKLNGFNFWNLTGRGGATLLRSTTPLTGVLCEIRRLVTRKSALVLISLGRALQNGAGARCGLTKFFMLRSSPVPLTRALRQLALNVQILFLRRGSEFISVCARCLAGKSRQVNSSAACKKLIRCYLSRNRRGHHDMRPTLQDHPSPPLRHTRIPRRNSSLGMICSYQ